MKDVIKTGKTDGEIKTINGRRVRVNRSERRNNLKGYYAIAGVFAAALAMFLCLTFFFKIKNVDIEGLTLYQKEQIMVVGGIQMDTNLIRTDTGIIEKRLTQTLPYLDSVSVTKKYPSTLVVKCTQAKKAADIEFDGAYYVLSYSGKILEAKNTQPTGSVPVVKGFELVSTDVNRKLKSADSFKAEILSSMLKILKKIKFSGITSIDLSSRSDIKLIYDNRIEINMGSSVDMEFKLTYLKAVITKKLPENYEGTLIYNGAESGISAIPKEQGVTTTIKKATTTTTAATTTTTTAAQTLAGQNDRQQTQQQDQQQTTQQAVTTQAQTTAPLQ